MLRRVGLVALLGSGPIAGCDPSNDGPPRSLPEALADARVEDAQPRAAPVQDDDDDLDLDLDDDLGDGSALEEALDAPIATLEARRSMMIYAEPSFGGPFRGRLVRGQSFHLHERVDDGDPECRGDDGWGRIGVSAYVCLRRTRPTEDDPVELPALADGMITPFHWARRRKRDVAPPVWRHRGAFTRGEEPIATLERGRDYAFVRRRRTRKGRILVDRRFRVVREEDVKRHRPSKFEGRDLGEDPVPEGKTLAWVVDWPGATLLAEPDDDARRVGRVKYQHTLYLEPGDPVERRRDRFWPVSGETPAWVNGKEIRRWNRHPPPPEGVDEREIWLDVDLGQHTLTIYAGDEPRYVTVVASGNYQNRTPRGLFRISVKQAWGDMRSLPGEAEEDAYHVEKVPWVMYFRGRYAMHGTFWHNRFGYRLSHGCINLAPKDAARVYAVTRPDPLPGWSSAYEHVDELGTLLRIRRGEEDPEDKRREPRQRRAK